MNLLKKENIIIVGAGVSGLALALFLARQGLHISIYDKRTVFYGQTDGRSINFTISGRGLSVLAELGLEASVLEHSAILVGRILHLQKEKDVRYQYGTKKSQTLLSIRRSTLIEILLNAVNLEQNIHFQAGFELTDIDEKTLTCYFFDETHKKMVARKGEYIIGADGLFSAVRNTILKKQITTHQQTIFSWGYKEYQFDRNDAEKLQLDMNYMHMWPKSQALLVAIPNTDKTFSVIFTAPLRDDLGELHNFNELVKCEFPNIVKTAPSFFNRCGLDPYYYLVSVKIDKWHLNDKIILIGDACHATYPFYGQGMNSALEDALLLSEHINNKFLSRLEAFIEYEKCRKKDMAALHQLSEAHLLQITKAMTAPFWQACNVLDYQLAKLFSNKWIYEYEMVAHSTIRYGRIFEALKKQHVKKILSGFYVIAFLFSMVIHANKVMLRFMSRLSTARLKQT